MPVHIQHSQFWKTKKITWTLPTPNHKSDYNLNFKSGNLSWIQLTCESNCKVDAYQTMWNFAFSILPHVFPFVSRPTYHPSWMYIQWTALSNMFIHSAWIKCGDIPILYLTRLFRITWHQRCCHYRMYSSIARLYWLIIIQGNIIHNY
jgi:hypothetical protein